MLNRRFTMKSEKTFAFFLLIAALIFCISCGGKGNKYDDLVDDYDTAGNDSEKEDVETVPVTDEDTDNNGDTEPDDSDTGSDSDEISDDTDSDTNEPRPDNDPNDEEPVPDEDNTVEPSDTDSISNKEDSEILCTGQTKCYNSIEEITCPAQPDPDNEDFFGQDAQYAEKGYCLPQSLDSANEQIVTDYNTGLVWQRKLPATYEGCSGNGGALCLYSQAVSFCDNLELENFDDWRLPTPEELETIIDYGRTPAINTDVFTVPNPTSYNFWAQTGSALQSSKKWYVNFTKGSVELDDNIAKLVRCVRGSNQLSDADFNEVDDEIVEDSARGLSWKIIESEEGFKWKKSLNQCKNLGSGWRLPSINELASLLDYSLYHPASDFPSLPLTSFWSSTSYNESPDYAWRINSSTGAIETGKKTKTASVICVK